MSEVCKGLHEKFNKMPRYRFPFNEQKVPLNGIYVLFEKGEKGHDSDRVVRVGTHTGDNQLRSRLKQHFINENKDRSIFRKNIGRALLNRNNDSFLGYWELDLTTRKAKDALSPKIDFKKQKEVERNVTKFIRDNFTFVVLGIEDKKKRLELESKVISSISACDECNASSKWLGNFSPKEKIRDSGLWLVNELYKTELTKEELNWLKELS